jgi:putative mRNA 3-end processing factor
VLRPDRGGLRCEAGGFWIDPVDTVDRAVVTHTHSDHLRPGHHEYFVSEPSVPLARRRLRLDDSESSTLNGVSYGETLELGDARVSLHPAGHMLGSAQIRVEVGGEVWVVSGDYKRHADPTCESFELVECDVFVTEATFGLPIYRWPSGESVAQEVYEWWQAGVRQDRPSVLFCYAVGKAQRILAHLADHTDDEVLVHGAMTDFNQMYREAGVDMTPTRYVTDIDEGTDFGGRLVLAPTSAHQSSWMRRFDDVRTGFASGWMRVRAPKRRRGYDEGFVMSDHCDWPDLLRTIRETGAHTVVADHGDTDALVRYVREEMELTAVSLVDERRESSDRTGEPGESTIGDGEAS